MASPPILGIDLGTRTCQAAIILDGNPHPIDVALGDNGQKYMPSVFLHAPGHAPENGRARAGLVGHEAIALTEEHDALCAGLVYDVKRKMKWDDERREWPESGGRQWPPSRIAGEFVAHIKKMAEKQLKFSLSTCVVTVRAKSPTIRPPTRARTWRATSSPLWIISI